MRARIIRGRQENDNTRPFAMLTGEAYHHIVQIMPKLVSNFMIKVGMHGTWFVIL